MKKSSFNLLAVSAAFFALCASGMAAAPKSIIRTACLKCHGGGSVNGGLDFTQVLTREQKLNAIAKVAQGEMPINGPKLTPEQVSRLEKELGFKPAVASSAPNAAPPTSALPKRPAPEYRSLNPPTLESHASLVEPSDDDTTADGPKVPARSPNSKPVVKSQPVAADTLNGDDVEKLLDMVSSVKGSASKKSDSSKGLKRDSMAASRQAAGEPWTVELQMDDNGWATLTIPAVDDESSTMTRTEEMKGN